MSRLMPGALAPRLLHSPNGTHLIGIDEDTALVGGPDEFTVHGRQSVWVLNTGGRRSVAAGESLNFAVEGDSSSR